MSIRDFYQKLQTLYAEMAETFAAYQTEIGLQCLQGCGKCCINPEIEASVLEMLPFALKLFDEGKLEEMIGKFQDNEEKSCLLLNGLCTSYETRPSICRMFGASGYFDKNRRVSLSICKPLKENNPALVEVVKASATPENTPMLMYWNGKLSDLDPQLIQERMPINQAILRALEKIALYAQYQPL